ncbi:hypothetical protein PoB_001776500 [Plakobranchus ocellatus]|uniref:Uncharacterized protein n=1 Tax=Plakobranchus ocellatus TaxID=259542 RepID=A0AAV3Z7X7_9GAST|nr:hypothetical protein PoB_001776500 [Plakobranchus ocellatus]
MIYPVLPARKEQAIKCTLITSLKRYLKPRKPVRGYRLENVSTGLRPNNTLLQHQTMACESALRSAGTLLSRVRAPLPAPWPDGGPESLRSPCCGLAIYKKLKPSASNS